MLNFVSRVIAAAIALILAIGVVARTTGLIPDLSQALVSSQSLPRVLTEIWHICAVIAIAAAVAGRLREAWMGSFALFSVAVAAFADWVAVARLHLSGAVQLDAIPLSAVVAVLAWLAAVGVLMPARQGESLRNARMAVIGGAAIVLLLPLFLMATFGRTDYRRAADVAVIFGARAYADGRPSDALRDRVLAGCDLYEDGLVQQLVLSGGPGDGAFSEAQVMKRVCMEQGVPESALVLDEGGVNSRATLRNLEVAGFGGRRVLLVSHFYHLPRLKVDAKRLGIDAYTVPAPQGRPLNRLPLFLAREVAAWWRSALLPVPARLAG